MSSNGNPNKNRGWIKLHRKITEWEWYGDPATTLVFLDLLLHASHNTYRWRGIEVKPGQVVWGRSAAAKRLGLSVKNVRTAIKHLKATSEVAIQTTNRYSLITICKWGDYQLAESKPASKVASQVAINRPATGHNQEGIEIREVEKSMFTQFWEVYPRKVGKKAAEKAYLKAIKSTPHEVILKGLEAQLPWFEEQKSARGDFRPHPSTWLNQGRWEDELSPVKQKVRTDF